MPDPIRLTIIGCGWAGVRHARAAAQCNTPVTWAVDLDPARARQVQALHPHARIAADYRQALAAADVDAVAICLPHNLHAPVAIAAAQAGKNILVEKPLAATLDEADTIIATADLARVTFMVAETVRFVPALLRAADLVATGVIGQPALVQLTREAYLRDSFLQDRPWLLDAEAAAGGMMMSGGVHDFEKLRMVVGEIASVQALRARQRFLEMEGDDTSVALVWFDNGAVGTLVESFIMKSLVTAAGPEVHTLRVDGDLGALWVPDDRTIRVFSEHPDWLVDGVPVETTISVPAVDPFYAEMAHFIECVQTGREPITSGRSQRRPLELVLAAYSSMSGGGLPVDVAPAGNNDGRRSTKKGRC